jgi:hypothetical protein
MVSERRGGHDRVDVRLPTRIIRGAIPVDENVKIDGTDTAIIV